MRDPEIPAAVLTAIQSGNVQQLETLYKTDLALNDIAIHASKAKQPQILEWCYSRGWAPPPESLNDDFYVAAMSSSSTDVFQVLLNHGWDINAHKTGTIGDALASAVMYGEYDFAKWLLEHGHKVNPNEPMYGGCSITSTLCGDQASTEMLRLLLDHGFKLKGYGAAAAAADEGNLEGLKLLLAHGGFDIDEVNMWWYAFDDDDDEPEDSAGSALYRACRQGHLECAQLLLDHGADPKAEDVGGVSCLEIAKDRGHEEIVKLLEAKGVTE
jgi:ankyrin repeat protein